VRRADRLFEIIQVLRRASGPLTAAQMAVELETSQRTIYRDIDALVAQRVPIRGEAGIGYVLDRGFDLPPLMLTIDEIEAVTLGAQWVIAHGDAALARAALGVLAKVAAVVPEDLRPLIDDPSIGTPPSRHPQAVHDIDVARLREWSRRGRKIGFKYRDASSTETRRIVWPFMVGYVATVRVVMAWCELRRDFRIFRTERMVDVEFLDMAYPEHSVVLRRRWLASRPDRQTGQSLKTREPDA
jgi:predicted DNA-binding transcriptional regulator YafY